MKKGKRKLVEGKLQWSSRDRAGNGTEEGKLKRRETKKSNREEDQEKLRLS